MPTVLVTSSSRGIGLEFVRQYAAEGWRVVAACRDPAGATALRAIEGDVRPVEMDVTSDAAVARVAGASGEPVDLLVNSAGIMGDRDGGAGRMDFALWAEVLSVNTLAPVRVLDAFVDRLAAAGGVAVTISSQMASIGALRQGNSVMYRSSKAAVNMAMRARSFELRARGITVAVLNPGWVRTDMGGPAADLSVEESVGGMRRVIAGLDLEGTGSFLDWRGANYPW